MKQVLYFHAAWCDKCQNMEPIIEQLIKSKTTQVAKVDTDYDSSLVEKYNVVSVPTTILLENGKETKRFIGYQELSKVNEFIKG